MGYYTTVTIDNAVVGSILNSPQEFTRKLIDACSGVYYRSGKDSFGLGIDVPFVYLQKPREFVERTLFIYNNGRLVEMNPHSSITNEIKEHNPEKFSELISYLEETLLSLSGKPMDLEGQELILDTRFTLDLGKEIINSGETNVMEKPDDEAIVAQWLKANKIPTTVAKLKKLKQTKIKK